MSDHALDELHDLLSRFQSPVHDGDPLVRYVCSLFAELAYYHVPQFEIDGKKRAKVIPCDVYQTLVGRGASTDLLVILNEKDFLRRFVVVDRGVIAVGVEHNRLLFIGFRGTQFLFDWRINLRCRLVPIRSRFLFRGPFGSNTIAGRLHVGFGEEAVRISSRILDAIRDSRLEDVDHVFLTGHSLGGAVAAIAENFIRVAPTSVCMFGAPRYSDYSAYGTLPNGPPTQVRRRGDIVPTVPPRLFGYVDNPYEFTTDGQAYVEAMPRLALASDSLRWLKFLAKRFRPHSVEAYRRELGKVAGASKAAAPLAPVEKLTRKLVANK